MIDRKTVGLDFEVEMQNVTKPNFYERLEKEGRRGECRERGESDGEARRLSVAMPSI